MLPSFMISFVNLARTSILTGGEWMWKLRFAVFILFTTVSQFSVVNMVVLWFLSPLISQSNRWQRWIGIFSDKQAKKQWRASARFNASVTFT